MSHPELTPDQIDAFRTRLQQRASQLVAEAKTVEDERTQPTGGPREHVVEDHGDEGERRTRQGLRDAEELRDLDELRDIAAALQRIDEGHFGECVDCATPIDPRRLDVQPAAARCLPCQEIHERLHPVELRAQTLP